MKGREAMADTTKERAVELVAACWRGAAPREEAARGGRVLAAVSVEGDGGAPVDVVRSTGADAGEAWARAMDEARRVAERFLTRDLQPAVHRVAAGTGLRRSRESHRRTVIDCLNAGTDFSPPPGGIVYTIGVAAPPARGARRNRVSSAARPAPAAPRAGGPLSSGGR